MTEENEVYSVGCRTHSVCVEHTMSYRTPVYKVLVHSEKWTPLSALNERKVFWGSNKEAAIETADILFNMLHLYFNRDQQ